MKNLLTFIFLSGIILSCDMVTGMSNQTENNSGPGGLVYSPSGEGQSPIATGAASLNKRLKGGIIYKATNLINGKVYIGMTFQGLKERKRNHEVAAFTKNQNYAFQSAIRKYGIDGFKWEIIDRCLFTEILRELEKYYIKKNNCKVPNGYNLTEGGDGSLGHKVSDDAKKRMSVSSIGKNSGEKHYLYGKHLSNETKDKQRLAMIGKPWTQARRDALNKKKDAKHE